MDFLICEFNDGIYTQMKGREQENVDETIRYVTCKRSYFIPEKRYWFLGIISVERISNICNDFKDTGLSFVVHNR